VGFAFLAALEALFHLCLPAIFTLLFFLALLKCLLTTSTHGDPFLCRFDTCRSKFKAPPVYSGGQRLMTIPAKSDRRVNGIAGESDRLFDGGFAEAAFCKPEHGLEKHLMAQVL
jgi:hypothetical protein